MFYYRAYAQTIASFFELPELIEISKTANPDITIREGDVPLTLEGPQGQGVIYQAKSDRFLLNLDHIARFLVQNGDEIVVQRVTGSENRDIRLFLLGSCMGALLHQQGILAFHASAIRTKGGAVLFAGRSGAGKSTLLGAFLRRGYAMLADDVVGIITDEKKRVMIQPAFPRTRLWADAAKMLNHDTDTLTQSRANLQKFDLDTRGFFDERSIPVYRIYLLSAHNKDEITLHPLPKISCFRTILYNTYRQQFLDGLGMRKPHFALAHALADQAKVIRVMRPSFPYRLKKLADMIEEDFSQHLVDPVE